MELFCVDEGSVRGSIWDEQETNFLLSVQIVVEALKSLLSFEGVLEDLVDIVESCSEGASNMSQNVGTLLRLKSTESGVSH